MSNSLRGNEHQHVPKSQTQKVNESVEPTIQKSSSSSCQQLSVEEKPKKKNRNKCRGNRKLQRYRAKLRKRGFSNENIAALINNYNEVNQVQLDQREPIPIPDTNVELRLPIRDDAEKKQIINQTNISMKRKRPPTPKNITTSLSQMSLSNIAQKRLRSRTMESIKEQQHQEEDGEEKNTNESNVEKKPKYLKVPDHIFKQLLSKSLAEGGDKFIQLLNTSEKLDYVRMYAHLLNNIFYWKLEQDYWEHYKRVCISESIWSVPMEKKISKENNLCRYKFKTESQLNRHLGLIGKKIKILETKFNEYKQRPLNDSSMDMTLLSTNVTAFVRQGQHKLNEEFQRKKLMIQFDANDHRRVKEFYRLNPTENQIRSAKTIWQATKDKLHAEERLAILKQRIYTKRLPSSFNLLDHSIDNVQHLLREPSLNEDKRATLSFRRLKTTAEFKYDMIILEIMSLEEIIRSHTNMIANQKQKLIDSTTAGQVPLPKLLVQLMNSIASRQSNMVQRSQCILKKKLSVFDDAPMTIEHMAGVIGANN